MPKKIHVQVADDFLRALSKVPPLDALEELVWNALDADATSIKIALKVSKLHEIEKITIKDNGHGMSADQIDHDFRMLGDSHKKLKEKTPKGRFYHGKLGRGRFKAFALGRTVSWISKVRVKDGLLTLSVSGTSLAPRDFTISDPVSSSGTGTGVEVLVDGCEVRLPEASEVVERLEGRLAPYLIAYSGIHIEYDDRRIDPQRRIRDKHDFSFRHEIDGKSHPISVTFIEWNGAGGSKLYLCSKNGMVLDEKPLAIHIGNRMISAYVKGDVIASKCADGLQNAEGLDPDLTTILKTAKSKVRDHFKQKDAATFIHDLQSGDAYPYRGKPQNVLEEAERQVFELCAYTIYERQPEMLSGDQRQTKLTLHLLRQSLETNPTSMKAILQEVLSLGTEDQNQLAELLERTTLTNLIRVGQMLAHRKQFLTGLRECVLASDWRKHMKERKHLQKIIEEELWIFGEEYGFISEMGGDVTLRNVLTAHLKVLGRTDLCPAPSANELGDIPDFCICRSSPVRQKNHFENVVVEIKGPSVSLDADHVMQIERYAHAVAADKRFDKDRCTWKFLLISSGMNDFVHDKVHQSDRPSGLLSRIGNLEIWAWTWTQLLQECEWRVSFLQEQLKYRMEDPAEGVEYIRKRYKEHLPISLRSSSQGVGALPTQKSKPKRSSPKKGESRSKQA